ncbi:MAG: SurA N-terminal domain-containing protein [Bdellovibrionales bacterium]
MLTSMRNFSKLWVTKGLLLLLALSFAIWGIGDMFRSNPSKREVASIGDQVITVQDLEFHFQKSLPDARRQFGSDLTAAQARQMGVLDQTLNLMVEQSAFDQEAARLGIDVGQDQIISKLASVPEFRDKDGHFRKSLFQDILRRTGMSEQFFLESERKDTARRLLVSALSTGAIVPKTMIDNTYQARGAKRILEIVSLRNDSVEKTAKPEKQALLDYYEGHKNEFVAPEYRGITIARLSPTEAVKDVIVTHEEVKKAYETNASAYTLPQRRDLVQVVLQDETRARKLLTKARSMKSLTQAAQTMKLTAIKMKSLDDKSVLPELYTTVFGIEENDIAGPIKSSLGWHVIELTKIYQGGPQPFDTVKETIRRSIQEERVGDLLARNVNQLDDMIAGGTPLEEIADALKLHLTRYPALTSTGEAQEAQDTPAKIPAKQEILQAAFSQETGEISPVIEDELGDYLVVRTDEIKPSHTLSFDEVRKDVKEAWLDEEMARRAADQANEMANAIRQGKSAISYASMAGVNVRLSNPISLLGDMDKDLIPTAIQHVFLMKKGDVITLSGPGRQYIIRLADIVPVDPNKPEPSRLKVVDDLKQVMPLEILNHYSRYVKKIFPVHIDSELLKELRNRSSTDVD